MSKEKEIDERLEVLGDRLNGFGKRLEVLEDRLNGLRDEVHLLLIPLTVDISDATLYPNRHYDGIGATVRWLRDRALKTKSKSEKILLAKLQAELIKGLKVGIPEHLKIKI